MLCCFHMKIVMIDLGDAGVHWPCQPMIVNVSFATVFNVFVFFVVHIVHQDEHLAQLPVKHKKQISHRTPAKDSCTQWVFSLEICFIIIASLISLCLFSCLHQEKNRKSTRSTRTVKAAKSPGVPPKSDTDFMQEMDRLTAGGKKVFLDLFAGSARVASHAQKVGLVSLALDIDTGYDLTDPDTVAAITRRIQKGEVLAVMLAPPCNSWSAARRGKQRIVDSKNGKSTRKVGWPRPLRSKAFIWGLHSQVQLTHKEFAVTCTQTQHVNSF